MFSDIRKYVFLIVSFFLWLVVMGIIVQIHYIDRKEPELGYFAPDIVFEEGTRLYFSIEREGQHVGYKSEEIIDDKNHLIYWENSVLKMNLAGMSREVFFQSTVTLDRTQVLSESMIFSIQSGEHQFECRGQIHADTLTIDVLNEAGGFWRRGLVIVPENTTFPTALPYYLHHMKNDTATFSLFDPFIFKTYQANAVRSAEETIAVDGKIFSAIRYEVSAPGISSNYWIDENGGLVKHEGSLFLSGIFGDLKIERAIDKSFIMLPLEVTTGNDILKSYFLETDRKIPTPRNTQYLEVQLDNIRAALIDISASNKQFLSANPVIFGIHKMPIKRNKSQTLSIMNSEADTSIVGTSNYVQSKDARFLRLARSIVNAEIDTLEMARHLNRWVHNSMVYDESVTISRALDVYRDRKGGSEEYTKLFTSLSRSIGIPTQIHSGLAYRDGGFRYHSWPSVFADGVWNDLDPMFGQDRADAARITLIRGDYDRLIELIRVLGQIQISVLDYK